MYTYKKYQFDWLKVFVATPSVGASWKKQFAAGVTPQNQFSLNIYTSGSFEITAPSVGFSQVLRAGQSSLEISLQEFPTDGLVLESPLEEPACRMCLSVDGGGKWSRTKNMVLAGQTFQVEQGQIAFVLPLGGWDGSGMPDIRVGTSINAIEDCNVFLMSLEK